MQKHDTDNRIEIRAAVALRAARTGLGWSQEIAAEKSGISKTTIARIETLAGQVSLGNIFRLIETYAYHGVDIADLKLRTVQLTFADSAILEAGLALTDPDRKRSDTGKRRGRKTSTETETETDDSST
jgi:transcriptional regulator with XRE-family HTH domain